jgi:ferredoxin--NADP+ reductase
VSALRTLVPLTAPLVRDGGELILLKGANAAIEIDGAEKALRKYRVSNVHVEVVGDGGAVSAFRFERTEPDGAGGVRGTGEIREIPIQALYRAVGYFGSPLDGIPFDDRHGVIPNHEGRVLDDSNDVVPGIYATGWIKRGPVGLIGHTKSDAMETVGHLVNDQASWWSPSNPEESAIVDLLTSRGVTFTDLDGWRRLDKHEKSLGEPVGRERIKVVDRDEMLRASGV